MKNLKKKAVFIIPYFGRKPVYYDNWAYTAKRNSDFDFLFVTDIKEITEDGNIHVLRMSFDEVRKLAQSKFDFDICLENPYKLCDFKPLYGYIFKDYIFEYEFWGHCDVDILMGQLNHFLTSEIFQQHDKILELGHMTLYRNNDTGRSLFMSDGPYPEMNYRDVLSTPESCWFDEFYGMMLKSRRDQTKTYLNPEILIDVKTSELLFTRAGDSKELYFEWNDGMMYSISCENHKKTEVAYVHFQKRDMSYMSGMFDKGWKQIYIFADHISEIDKYKKISAVKQKKYSIQRKILHIKDFCNRYRIAKKYYSGLVNYYQSRQNLKKRRKKANAIINQ